MKVAVFTLTCRYGGLDVSASCLRGHDLTWIVGDTLDRGPVLARECPEIRSEVFDAPRASAGYNEALRRVRAGGYDLMLFLCDYTWFRRDCFARWEYMARQYPQSLLTGLCSHSLDPGPERIHDPHGLYTIFEKPFEPSPLGLKIGWRDVRKDEAIRRYGHRGPFYPGVDIEWNEMNWAAIPKALLDDDRLWFNEEYDRGFGHENQDFALKAQALGYDIVLDVGNHAVELPHRDYFPEEWASMAKVREEQMRWHEARRRAARCG